MVRNLEKIERQNLILVGIKGKPETDTNKYEEYTTYLEMQVTDFQTNKGVVTDDFAPIGN